jgi:hypothetical protein
VPAAPRSVSRLTSRHHRFARTAFPRAGLGHAVRTTQDAFHRLGPRPCDRGRRLCAYVSEHAFALWHRFACCDGLRRRPTTRSSASRYPAGPRPSCDDRVRERGGCSSPTSATDLRHVHLLSIARFPVCSVHFRSPLTIQQGCPCRTRRAGSHLTMRSALRSIRRSRVPPSGGRGRP